MKMSTFKSLAPAAQLVDHAKRELAEGAGLE